MEKFDHFNRQKLQTLVAEHFGAGFVPLRLHQDFVRLFDRLLLVFVFDLEEVDWFKVLEVQRLVLAFLDELSFFGEHVFNLFQLGQVVLVAKVLCRGLASTRHNLGQFHV